MRKLKLQELNRVDNEAFKKQPKTPLVLVLDNIRSGLNVGSAFRTSDGFGLEKIYLCGITATPPQKEILKTANGASESVAWEYSDTTLKTILKLKKAGFKIVAVEQVDQRTWLQDFIIDFGIKYALVFGNEVDGISEFGALRVSTPEGVRNIPNDYVLALTGYQPDLNFLKAIGVDLSHEENKIPKYNTETMESNIEGLYLAGVICGGMETHKWFIENSRVHAKQIVKHIEKQIDKH